MFNYYSFLDKSVRKSTQSLIHTFWGLTLKKQNGSTKNSTKGKMRLRDRKSSFADNVFI